MNVSKAAWNPLRWLAELTDVWKDTRLIVLTAQIAAIYAAILIPFKVGIPLIPGFAELRPANAIPIVTSLLFGPAAAWGAGIGNIIGDCFGTLGPASVFGFLGNFLFGYVPYLLWGNLGPLSSGQVPMVISWRQGLEYGIVCFIASAACAGTIAWGVELLGLLPFTILAPAIFFNNLVMGFLLGPPLLLFLYPRVTRWGLRYQDLRREADWEKSSLPEGPHPIVSSLREMSGEVKQANDDGVDVRNLTFQYRHASAPTLHHLSLHVRHGEIVALMGKGRAGKSTLCFILNGLIPRFVPGSFEGAVCVEGRVTTHQPVWQQAETVGLVFQDFDTQLVSTNVEMELSHSLEQLSPPPSIKEMAERIQKILHQVGLAGLNRRDPLSLSGGQRQRLVIASILVRQPAFLVLDQPMTDLDPAARAQLLALFQNVQQDGMAVVMAEQESEDVLHTDRVCVLRDGRVGWEGPPCDFFRQPDLGRQSGIRPLSLAECFEGLGLPTLPVTVQEAWQLADAHGLTLRPSKSFSPSPSSSTVLLHFKKVSFTYPGEVMALEDVSFTIRAGEFVAILGQNGSGKSTLAKLLNGLLHPTEGKVCVAGKDTRDVSIEQLAKIVGYVFQNPDHQIFAETVWEEVAFGAKNMGCVGNDCAYQVVEALKAVGLDVERSRRLDPFSLTKGERQRVAVASVLAMRPRILIFDEPTTGLDWEETDRMMEMIRQLHQQGHTIVMITHTLRLVATYASRCLLMKEGRVIGDGPTRDVFSRPALLESASLAVPPLTRFSHRWDSTLLTIDEVKAALKKK